MITLIIGLWWERGRKKAPFDSNVIHQKQCSFSRVMRVKGCSK